MELKREHFPIQIPAEAMQTNRLKVRHAPFPHALFQIGLVKVDGLLQNALKMEHKQELVQKIMPVKVKVENLPQAELAIQAEEAHGYLSPYF